MSGFYTRDDLADDETLWADADQLSDDNVGEVLAIAAGQVLEYAPALAEVDPPVDPLARTDIPANYRRAQLMQAKNLVTAGAVAPSGELGTDTFVITPHPLDWMIKQLLRPKRAVPVVG